MNDAYAHAMQVQNASLTLGCYIPTIECTTGQRIFHNTFCDIGSGVNILSKVTYEYLFGDEPMFPTYMQL
jgi:hypothetical protein